MIDKRTDGRTNSECQPWTVNVINMPPQKQNARQNPTILEGVFCRHILHSCAIELDRFPWVGFYNDCYVFEGWRVKLYVSPPPPPLRPLQYNCRYSTIVFQLSLGYWITQRGLADLVDDEMVSAWEDFCEFSLFSNFIKMYISERFVFFCFHKTEKCTQANVIATSA